MNRCKQMLYVLMYLSVLSFHCFNLYTCLIDRFTHNIETNIVLNEYKYNNV